ncbi:MFS transporter [Jatrophihabitans sp. YIM 134969]
MTSVNPTSPKPTWWPLVAVCLGSLMLLVDVSIVNVALPAMAVDLSATFSDLQWVVDGYALVLAATLLAAGTLGDRLGHRRVYLVGLVLFAAASLASGLAGNVAVLVAARAAQGIGGAAMFATTFALLNSSYQGRARGTAYGIWGAVAGAATAIGPVVGGLLTEHAGWRWIFFVNLPVTVVTVVLGVVALSPHDHRSTSRLDVPGVVSFTLFAGALTYGLIEAGSRGWGDARPLASFAVALVALAAFVVRERTTAAPMFDLALLRHRVFAGTLLAGSASSLVAFSSLVFVSIWLQSVLGLSSVEAGLAGGLPLSAAALVASAAGSRVLHGRPPGPVIAGGVLLIGLGSLLMALQLRGAADWPALFAGLAVAGVGVGITLPVLNSAAMSTVPLHRGGMAAGAVNTARQLGLALGLAVLGTVLTSAMTTRLTDLGVPGADRVAQGLAGGGAAALRGTPGADRFDTVFVDGLREVMLVAGGVGVVAAVAVAVLMRPGRTAPTVPGPHAGDAPTHGAATGVQAARSS